MSARTATWSVADAKAHLSELIERARAHPQTITRRGRPLVAVVPIEVLDAEDDAGRWRRFLDVCAAIRSAGGGDLVVPRRTTRRSPFGRS